ncbi:MAG TPA: VOC family protein [Candidatus Bathyarchaeia archaeon]|nr:VOC family protein [Candidatus Bathyarchaeia archaeon]
MGRPIVHFEIPAGDVERLKKFYADCFGWVFTNAQMPGIEYWLFTTGKNSPAGGMYRKQDTNEHPRNYVHVEEIDAAIQMFQGAGGTIKVPKQEIPGVGFTAIGLDPEGNAVGLFEPVKPPPRKRAKRAKKKTIPKRQRHIGRRIATR